MCNNAAHFTTFDEVYPHMTVTAAYGKATRATHGGSVTLRAWDKKRKTYNVITLEARSEQLDAITMSST